MTIFMRAGRGDAGRTGSSTSTRVSLLLALAALAAVAGVSTSLAPSEPRDIHDIMPFLPANAEQESPSLWEVAEDFVLQDLARFHAEVLAEVPDLVPADVKCTKTKRCDKKKVCAIVCEHGSVVVPAWLQRALRLQRKLAYRRNFCAATLPGTHNSAINLADGYGVEDHVYQGYLHYFSWFKKGMVVHTNDQLFSLTDQLRLGVRFIELDTHWFDGDLRIAHCGGFHSKLLDGLIYAFNKIAKMLGTDIEWDSETIGCKPSLSSIPSSEQRSLKDALKELATWLHAPENADEFLLVFFDDETNLMRWKKVARLLEYLKAYFPEKEMLLPSDLVYDTKWPAFQELLDAGKRVLFMSGADYLTSGQEILFVKNTICNWTEPRLPVTPFPVCSFESTHSGPRGGNWTIFRPETSEIQYGFLNSDGKIGSNKHLLDEKSLPDITNCGVNLPSPDNITPKRMEATVWVLPKDQDLDPNKCVALTRGATTWQSVDCQADNMVPACVDATNPHVWQLGASPVVEADAEAACPKLPQADMEYSVPASGYENEIVHSLLTNHADDSIAGVWLNAKALVAQVYSEDQESVAVESKAGLRNVAPIDSVLSVE